MLVCEAWHKGRTCAKPAQDYKRRKGEAKGWPNPNTPIALCNEHAGNRKPIQKENEYSHREDGVYSVK